MKENTGQYHQELIFDSKLTTYTYLYTLNLMGIRFITLKRRTKKILNSSHKEHLSAREKLN